MLILAGALALTGCAGVNASTARSHILGAIVRGFVDAQDAERYVDPCQSAGKKSMHCPVNFGSQLAVAGTSAAYRDEVDKRARDKQSAAYRLALLEFIEAQDAVGLELTAERSLVIVDSSILPPAPIEMDRISPGSDSDYGTARYETAVAGHAGR